MKPQVELLVRPDVKDFRAVTKFLENIARVCYQSEGKITKDSDLALVDKLLKNKHMAIFEHVGYDYDATDYTINATLRHYIEEYDVNSVQSLKQLMYYPFVAHSNEQTLTFRVITNRGVTHELVRHRQSSFVQESTCYVKYLIAGDADQLCILPKLMPLYFEIMDTVGVQMAMGVLPTSLKSEIIMTFHKRVWFDHFLSTSNVSHPEIQYIANRMKGLVYEDSSRST